MHTVEGHRDSAMLKRARMEAGERVIMSDYELDALIEADKAGDVCSAFNADRLGMLDAYVAWIKPSAAPVIVRRDADGRAFAKIGPAEPRGDSDADRHWRYITR